MASISISFIVSMAPSHKGTYVLVQSPRRVDQISGSGRGTTRCRVAVCIIFAVALIFAKDLLLSRYMHLVRGLHVPHLSYVLDAITDEPAHAVTALLYTGALYSLLRRRLTTRIIAAAIVGGTLIDLDHLPDALGHDLLTVAGSRPFTHSLPTLGLLLLLAFRLHGTRRELALVAALALGSHFIRDLSYAPVPLFWPIVPRGITIPYVVYAATLVACGLVIILRWRDPPDMEVEHASFVTCK
jgi:hypothetical protein